MASQKGNPKLLASLYEPSPGRFVQGIVMLGCHVYVVHYRSKEVEVFDCEDGFKKVNSIKVEGLERPGHMVGSPAESPLYIHNEQLFIIDDDVIRQVNIKTGVSNVFFKRDLDRGDPDNEPDFMWLSIVEDRLLFSSPDSLLMYNIQSGDRMKEIPFTEDFKKEGVVRYAMESIRNSFFVNQEQINDSYIYTVSEIDSEGRVIRAFNDEQYCFFGSNMLLNSVGSLLLSAVNIGVIILDEHLKFERILIDNDKKDHVNTPPVRLAYNRDYSKLAVGNYKGQVKIFDCRT